MEESTGLWGPGIHLHNISSFNFYQNWFEKFQKITSVFTLFIILSVLSHNQSKNENNRRNLSENANCALCDPVKTHRYKSSEVMRLHRDCFCPPLIAALPEAIIYIWPWSSKSRIDLLVVNIYGLAVRFHQILTSYKIIKIRKGPESDSAQPKIRVFFVNQTLL